MSSSPTASSCGRTRAAPPPSSSAISPSPLDPQYDLEPRERFVSLTSGFDPRPPVAAGLGQALDHLLGQALAYEFPAAPDFEAEVKPLHLNKVWQVVAEAAQSEDG